MSNISNIVAEFHLNLSELDNVKALNSPMISVVFFELREQTDNSIVKLEVGAIGRANGTAEYRKWVKNVRESY